MRKYIIYKITNLTNNKIYIGRTSIGIQSRWRDHINRFKAGDYNHLRLYRAFSKYGIENFQIEEIDSCNSFEDMKRIEGEWILKLKSFDKSIGYNMAIDTSKGIEFLDETVLENRSKSIRKTMANKTKEKGKYLGVVKPYLSCPSWRAIITIDSKRIGFSFDTPEEAAEFYDKLAIYAYGKDTSLNFPEKLSEYLLHDISDIISGKTILARSKRVKPIKREVTGITFHNKHGKWSFTVYNSTNWKRLNITKFETEEDAKLAQEEFIINNPCYVRSKNS